MNSAPPPHGWAIIICRWQLKSPGLWLSLGGETSRSPFLFSSVGQIWHQAPPFGTWGCICTMAWRSSSTLRKVPGKPQSSAPGLGAAFPTLGTTKHPAPLLASVTTNDLVYGVQLNWELRPGTHCRQVSAAVLRKKMSEILHQNTEGLLNPNILHQKVGYRFWVLSCISKRWVFNFGSLHSTSEERRISVQVTNLRKAGTSVLGCDILHQKKAKPQFWILISYIRGR